MALSPKNLKSIRRFGGQIPPPKKRAGANGPGVNKSPMKKGSGKKLKGFMAKVKAKSKKKKK